VTHTECFQAFVECLDRERAELVLENTIFCDQLEALRRLAESDAPDGCVAFFETARDVVAALKG
jgi:hypothetical protein